MTSLGRRMSCALVVAGLLALTTGCGSEPADDQDSTTDLPDDPVEAAPVKALALASAGGCALGSDCDAGLFCFQGSCAYECKSDEDCDSGRSCSPRGQCVSGAALREAGDTQIRQQPLVTDYFDNLNVLNSPQTMRRATSSSDQIALHLEFDAALPPDGMPYRATRTDDIGDPQLVEYTRGGGTAVDIPIALGAADPTLSDSKVVYTQIYTPVGSFQVGIEPSYPVSGRYGGKAKVDTFGSVGLPVDFEVVTDPANSTLEQATSVWLVLPVASDKLFSPVYPDGSVDHLAAALEYDEFVDRWVANFDTAFDLTGSGIWNSPRPDQVERTMRFEISFDGKDRLVGAYTDIWKGLYEADSAQGVTTLQPVVTTGELALRRVGDARAASDLNDAGATAADPKLFDAPGIQACRGLGVFEVSPRDIDGQTYSCEAIASAADFEGAAPAQMGSCAAAVSDQTLSGQTTSTTIRAFLDDSIDNPGARSFEEFLADCADVNKPACRPSPEVQCSRQLLARAYHDQQEGSAQADMLMTSYLDVARESYLGQQMAAFTTDLAMRREWLENQNYDAVVTSAVEDLNKQLLRDWKDKVLEVHLGVLTGQFDPSGLAVMARETDSAGAKDARQRLLLEMTQSWRGAQDSLTLATSRWNTLLQAQSERSEKADYVATQMFKLYVSAAALRNLARSSGAGALTAGFGAGFSNLVEALQTLRSSFDDRVYARDGEVVVNTSINPQDSNDNLLSDRRTAALGEIDEAHQAITTMLADARAEALDEQQLRNRLNNQITDLRSELVERCGLPQGCSLDDWAAGADGCEVDTRPGYCGYTIDRESGDVTGYKVGEQNTSEAGTALLTLLGAAQNVQIAKEDYNALADRLSLDEQALEAFAADIESWQRQRAEFIESLEQNIADRQEIRNDAVADILANIAERAQTRQQAIDGDRATFAKWNTMRHEDDAISVRQLTNAVASRKAARELGFAAETTIGFAEVAAEAVPDEFEKAAIPSAAISSSILLVGRSIATGLEVGALNNEAAAEELDLAREMKEMTDETTLAHLEDQSSLGSAITDDELATLRDAVTAKEQLTTQQIEMLEQAIELDQAETEADLAHERDLADFREDLKNWKQKLTRVFGLEVRIQQAKVQFMQRIGEYLEVSQTAQLRSAKLADLLRQRDNINQLVGSPAAIFSGSNDLERGERKLGQAKDALMDWLVTLEYYAVRPFMDQRLQILLARNTYQLDKIADELDRLQRDCGGPTNQLTTTLSVRDDLLGMSQSVTDPVTGEEFGPAQRFRRVLQRGYVPVGKKVRYSSDQTIGNLMSSNSDVLAATFFLSVDDFANLELTCNAKVRTVNVKLVGEVGDGRPTVTLLYDGTSSLLSCQPNIAEYVDQFGPGATSFGRITHLRTPGRSMSPVAGINEFPGADEEANTSFGGLPLVTQYTVLIDKTAGENQTLDWSKLEDIDIELAYTYQDVFPEGQCQ